MGFPAIQIWPLQPILQQVVYYRIEFYEVSIYTEAGEIVWKETVQGATAILPDSVRKALITGGSYSWQVEAQTEGGEQLKSQSIQFRMKQ